jgi:lipid-binding SYLF domain-containing protein
MPRFNSLVAPVLTAAFLLMSLSSAPSAISPTVLEDELLGDATLVFQRAVGDRAAAIPASVLMRAYAMAVFPHMVKDEARYVGEGVMSARGANPSYWTPPAVIELEGAIPLDLESRTVDFVLVAQTRRGLDYLIEERFVSAVIVPIEPGPLGRDTRVRLNADLLGYMQFGNYFAGVTIADWAIRELKPFNARLYGRPYSTEEIVRGAGFFHLPPAARAWREAVLNYFREMS